MEETRQFWNKKRICALLTVLVMIANLFSPYSILVNKVQAASIEPGKPYFKMSILQPGDPDATKKDKATKYYYYGYLNGEVSTPEEKQTRAIFIELSVNGCSSVNAGDINFKYDTSKLIPAQVTVETEGDDPYLEEATTWENEEGDVGSINFCKTGWAVPINEEVDMSAGTIRFTGSIKQGKPYLTDGKVVGTFLFLLKDGVTLDNLTSDAISIVTGADGLQDGLEITYYPDGENQEVVDGVNYLEFAGFATNEVAEVTGISLENNPTKSKYFDGEDLSLSDGQIKITYTDSSLDETLTIADAIAQGKITLSETVADKNSKQVTITAGTQTVTWNYNVATSMELTTEPSTTEYNHGDTINLSGGVITVKYDDNSTDTINLPDPRITADKTTANALKPNVKLTSTNDTSLEVTLNLTVNDAVKSVSVISNPTNVTYNHDADIDYTNGKIKVIRESGKEETYNMTDANVIKPQKADIDQCSPTWQNGSLTAGTQNVTVEFEGKTATFPITVNDVITGIQIKTQPTAKNKYDTAQNDLVLTGGKITVTTGSGKSFDTDITPGMLKGYVASTLLDQNIPVEYAGMQTTAGNGVEIKLVDYIVGITVTAPEIEVNYNSNSLPLTGVTYVKNYKSGATSASKNISSSMISGFNKTPEQSKFDSNHECTQTITVTLSTPDDADVDTIPVSDTFDIKIKDTISGIIIENEPKTTYNYGDTFEKDNGSIRLQYSSGATESSTIPMSDPSVEVTEWDGSELNMSPEKQISQMEFVKSL